MNPSQSILLMLALLVVQKGEAGTPVVLTCVPAPAGLVSFWPGDGNSNDVIGANSPTQTIGTPQFIAAEVGSGMRFSGINGYVVPDSPDLNFGTAGAFTLEGWVRLDVALGTSEYVLVDKRSGNSGATTGYRFRISSSGPPWKVGLFLGNGTATATAEGPVTMGDANFHHLAAVCDRANNTITLYADGRSVSAVLIGLNNFGDISNNGRLFIGHSSQDAASSGLNSLNGVIDELSLYRRALSDSEIQAIYSAGTRGKCLPPFRITTISRPGTSISLRWQSHPGVTYRVQYKPNLNPTTAWINVPGDITATDVSASKTDVLPPNTPRRFYQVERLGR